MLFTNDSLSQEETIRSLQRDGSIQEPCDSAAENGGWLLWGSLERYIYLFI